MKKFYYFLCGFFVVLGIGCASVPVTVPVGSDVPNLNITTHPLSLWWILFIVGILLTILYFYFKFWRK